MEDLNRNKETLFEKPFYFDEFFGDNEIEVAVQYNDSYAENIYSFANNINTEEGGAHLEGFKNSLTKIINDAGKRIGVLKNDDKVSGEDVREGISAVISVKPSSATAKCVLSFLAR